MPDKTIQVLAKKMTVLYKLAAEQLSKQHHYDFGLRALKSVLVMAGALKRGSPGTPEHLVLMRALRDMNLPKFVYDDVPLFLGLVRVAVSWGEARSRVAGKHASAWRPRRGRGGTTSRSGWLSHVCVFKAIACVCCAAG